MALNKCLPATDCNHFWQLSRNDRKIIDVWFQLNWVANFETPLSLSMFLERPLTFPDQVKFFHKRKLVLKCYLEGVILFWRNGLSNCLKRLFMKQEGVYKDIPLYLFPQTDQSQLWSAGGVGFLAATPGPRRIWWKQVQQHRGVAYSPCPRASRLFRPVFVGFCNRPGILAEDRRELQRLCKYTRRVVLSTSCIQLWKFW